MRRPQQRELRQQAEASEYLKSQSKEAILGGNVMKMLRIGAEVTIAR